MSRRFVINLVAFFGGFFFMVLAGAAFADNEATAMQKCNTAAATSQYQIGGCIVKVAGTSGVTDSGAVQQWAYWYTAAPSTANWVGPVFYFTPSVCDSKVGSKIDFQFFMGWKESPAVGSGFVGGVPSYVPPDTVSDGSCLAAGKTLLRCYSFASNASQAFCVYEYEYTGEPSSAAPPGNNAPSTACATGYAPGTVNGVTACYPTGASASTSFVVAGAAPAAGTAATGTDIPAQSTTLSAAPPQTVTVVGGGGGGGGTAADVAASLANQAATNAKLDALIAKPDNLDISSLDKESTQQAINTKLGQLHTDLTTTAGPGGGNMPSLAAPLYATKYPGGLSGMWDSHKAALMSSPLGAAIANMAVPVGVGAEPSWTFQLWHVNGTFTLAMASWIWSAVRAIMLLSAAFVCRRIIFGG